MKRSYLYALPALVLAVLTASACASRPEVRLNRNPSVSFSEYKTFAFVNPNMESDDRSVTVFAGRMREATRQELERRNYVYSERNPDLLVDLASGRVSDGALSVDLFDSRRNTRVWRGFALEDRAVGELTVSELFVGFPINRTGGDLASAWN